MDFNLNDFNYEGFDGSTYAQLQQLTKALEANTGVTNIAGMTDFQSLQLQSMETTLAMLTATDKKLTLWRDIAKGGATSTIEEYAAQFGYGQDNGGWVQQSENPVEADAQFSREFSIVKFNRQMWKFSDVAGMVSVITPAEKAQKEAASMRCLRAYNSSLYSGNSAMVAEQIDGFAKVIENNGSVDHVVDFRGVTPTERAFSDAAELIIANFGNVDGAALYCSPGGISTLNQLVGASFKREVTQFGAGGAYNLGGKVVSIDTPFGSLVPKTDIFLAAEYEARGVPKIQDPANKKSLIEGKLNSGAPDTPSIAVTTQASVSGSKWAATGMRPTGNLLYNYRVAAGNRFGLSIACASANAGSTNYIVPGGSNTLAITKAGTGAVPTYHEIYSEQVCASGDFKLIDRVAYTASPMNYVDKNINIPGTARMFLLDLTSIGEERTFMLKRLAPLFSQEYARIGPWRWGTVSLYATPQFYAPLRFVEFKNVPIALQSANKFLNF